MNRLIVNADHGTVVINKNIYGHFIEHVGRCIYDGIWVGEDSTVPNVRGIRKDIVDALKRINIPVLRWPGGCFADNYHWSDGIGPLGERPCTINMSWGDIAENNHFGTHEYMDFCEQLCCEPYIVGNICNGTAHEMQQWIEYITHAGKSRMADLRRRNGRDKPWKLKYCGIGNETWCFGGNMRPEYYADVYKHYQTSIRNYNKIPCHLRMSGDDEIYKIACGSRNEEYFRTEVLMREAAGLMSGLSLHYFSSDPASRGAATGFDEKQWFGILEKALYMDELITKHSAVMDKYDPEQKVGLIVDEWGAWYDAEPGTNPAFLCQQNTLRDALVAAVQLNIFNNHCGRVRMANIAQLVNVMQALIRTEGEKILLTPTYHVFNMYKVHQQAKMIPVNLACGDYTCGNKTIDELNVSASQNSDGIIHISICNLNPNKDVELICNIKGFEVKNGVGSVLVSDAMDAKNTFDDPTFLGPAEFNDFRYNKQDVILKLPAKSVVLLRLE